MIVDTKEAIKSIIDCIIAKLPVFIHGDPGCGKSDIVKQIAKKYNMKLIDIRLSQIDPTEMLGFPSIRENFATYVPMDIFPIQRDVSEKEKAEIAKGKDPALKKKGKDEYYYGFLLFLDEFNSASLAVQASAYKLILDRKVGQYDLHPKTAIVAAGNKASSNAIVNRVSTAMQSRFIHLELGVNIATWIDWAASAKIDHRIIAYVHDKPEYLLKFDPDHNDYTFSSPRTWAFVSQLIKNKPDKLDELTAVLCGAIGEPIAREFIMYTETYTRLPTIKQILADPLKAPLDDDPSMRYATAHMLAAHATKNNIPVLIKYIERLPLEFETITLHDIIQRESTMINEPVIEQWIAEKGMELF